jgi:Na+/H+ antiporter 1
MGPNDSGAPRARLIHGGPNSPRAPCPGTGMGPTPQRPRGTVPPVRREAWSACRPPCEEPHADLRKPRPLPPAPPPPPLRLPAPIRRFLREEAAGGVAPMVAAAVALGWANSPWRDAYTALWATPVTLRLPHMTLEADLRD